MREKIEPEDYTGVYYDEIREDDLIIMGERPDKVVGCMKVRRGIYDSLWRLSLETDLGMVIDIRRIPFAQTYIDKCNREDTDPYEQPLDLDIYVSHPLSEYHLRKDIVVIGYFTARKTCRLISKDRESFLSRERRDHE